MEGASSFVWKWCQWQPMPAALSAILFRGPATICLNLNFVLTFFFLLLLHLDEFRCLPVSLLKITIPVVSRTSFRGKRTFLSRTWCEKLSECRIRESPLCAHLARCTLRASNRARQNFRYVSYVYEIISADCVMTA